MSHLPDDPGRDTIRSDTVVEHRSGELLLGRYELIEQVGRGGMGVVWKALDRTLDDTVAVKLLHPWMASNKRALADLRDEAKLSFKLSHPSILRLRTFEVDESRRPPVAFLVMDYIEGQTLDELLADHRDGLPIEEVGKWAPKIAEAIDYAHEQSVLHRDIKPANIMLADDGRALLMAFGIARTLSDTQTRMTGRDSSGSLCYMSPQQLRGKNSKTNDIYSFATTLYESLCGTPPFHTGDIRMQILEVDPPPLFLDNEALENLITSGLAKEPESRPVTAAALLRPNHTPDTKLPESVRRVDTARRQAGDTFTDFLISQAAIPIERASAADGSKNISDLPSDLSHIERLPVLELLGILGFCSSAELNEARRESRHTLIEPDQYLVQSCGLRTEHLEFARRLSRRSPREGIAELTLEQAFKDLFWPKPKIAVELVRPKDPTSLERKFWQAGYLCKPLIANYSPYRLALARRGKVAELIIVSESGRCAIAELSTRDPLRAGEIGKSDIYLHDHVAERRQTIRVSPVECQFVRRDQELDRFDSTVVSAYIASAPINWRLIAGQSAVGTIPQKPRRIGRYVKLETWYRDVSLTDWANRGRVRRRYGLTYLDPITVTLNITFGLRCSAKLHLRLDAKEPREISFSLDGKWPTGDQVRAALDL